ncbi:MAG TPA: phosphate signaling complex protein PhoU [Armatimonadota bacterium]
METGHIRKSFDEQLEEIKQEILKMGSAVEEMLVGAIKALKERNVSLADGIIAKDDVVDAYNLQIEKHCLSLLALQQPMASDLRTIAAALYIIKDVERMGDYALDIAKAAKKLAAVDPVKTLVKIPAIADIVQRMLRDSLQAFVNHDVRVVSEVANLDDEVDILYRQIRDEMIELIQGKPELAQPAVELILVARYLERIADHVTNVGERIAYMETGDIKELH